MREQRLLSLFVLHHRTKQDLTVKQLAALCEIKESTISSIELERSGGYYLTVCKILSGLGKTLSDLDEFNRTSEFFKHEPPIFKD